jgi:4-hydroxy-tetrahydrodipicolinate synthase
VIEIIANAESGFAVWSGDDVMTLPIVAAGGAGAIAVSSNIIPGRFVAFTDALIAGDLARARDLMYDMLPLVRALTMSFEVNPIPVKTAAAILGMCAEEFRLPLTPMSPANRSQLERVLREHSLA